METGQREFFGEADIQTMMALVRAWPAEHLHVIDLPYRLSSWALDDAHNAGLWVDGEGELLAWAVLQAPFWTIDYVCDPQAGPSLHRQVLSWADRRARELFREGDGRPAWFIMAFADQVDRIRDLEEAGFACQANVGDNSWSKVLLRRSFEEQLAESPLPEGFTIRPLAGAGEVEAYVKLHRAAFESYNMTVEWRARILRRPEYHPELDCVGVAPDGRLAAFCIGWLDHTAKPSRGQIEPLGVHPDFGGLGLGRAMLTEVLRGLYRLGAVEVHVETDNYRDTALAVYQSVGFRAVRQVLVYRKDYDRV